MRVNIDKFFLLELQERGYDFDYNKLTEIFKASRRSKEEIEEGLRSSDEAIRKAAHERFRKALLTTAGGKRLIESIKKDEQKKATKKPTRWRRKRKVKETSS